MKIDKEHAFSVSCYVPFPYEWEGYKKALFDLEWQIRWCYRWGFTDYLVGVQKDTDMQIALAVSEVIKSFNKEGVSLRFFVAWPWKTIETHWDKERIDTYKCILSRADEVFHINNDPERVAHWMIDNASGLISDGYYPDDYGVVRKAYEYAWSKIQNNEDYYINHPD